MRKINKATLTLAAVMLVSAGLQARPLVIHGNLLTGDTSGAVYEISSAGSKKILTNPAYASSYAASGGGTYHDGVYYMSKIWMSGYSSQTYSFDTNNSPWTSIASDGNGSSTVLSTDYAYDAEANVIYGFHKQAGSNYVIGKITPGASWSRKLVQVQSGPDMVDVKIDCSNAENKWHGLAFDGENQLWVITFGGALNKVDKNTGAMTLVGETGVKPTVNGSAAFDFKTGKLYWAVKNSEGSFVYEVNTTTAEAIKVMDVPENLQLMGIYIPSPAAEDGAPASPVNVHYSFEEGSLSGNLVFDVPATTFDDNAASGSVNYSVTIGDNEPITGTANYGDVNVEVPFSVVKSGKVTAQLYLENEVGKSPDVIYEAYIGYGVPEKPADVKLDYQDGKMILTWSPVTSVVNEEGYLGEVTYTVVRNSNDVSETVAENISETLFEEAIEEPESGLVSYSYEVTASNAEFKSAAASAVSTLGSLALPYENEFNTEEDFNMLTKINVEPASKTWVYSKSGKCVTISYDKSFTKDDWLITPPVQLIKGNTYNVSVSAKSQSNSYKEMVELAWGLNPTAEGMSNIIVRPEEEVPTTPTVYEGSFIADETCKAYIGVHACSEKDKSTLTIDDLKISEIIDTGISSVAAGDNATVCVNGSSIIVKGDASVIIAGVDGTVVFNASCDGQINCEVTPGIYVVKANGNTVKVVVK